MQSNTNKYITTLKLYPFIIRVKSLVLAFIPVLWMYIHQENYKLYWDLSYFEAFGFSLLLIPPTLAVILQIFNSWILRLLSWGLALIQLGYVKIFIIEITCWSDVLFYIPGIVRLTRWWSDSELFNIASEQLMRQNINANISDIEAIVFQANHSVPELRKSLNAYIQQILNIENHNEFLQFIIKNLYQIIASIPITIIIGLTIGYYFPIIWSLLFKESNTLVLTQETAGLANDVANIARLQLDLTRKVDQINTHVIQAEDVAQVTRDNLLQVHHLTALEADQIFSFRSSQLQFNESIHADLSRLTEANEANTLFIMTTAKRLRDLINEVAAQ